MKILVSDIAPWVTTSAPGRLLPRGSGSSRPTSFTSRSHVRTVARNNGPDELSRRSKDLWAFSPRLTSEHSWSNRNSTSNMPRRPAKICVACTKERPYVNLDRCYECALKDGRSKCKLWRPPTNCRKLAEQTRYHTEHTSGLCNTHKFGEACPVANCGKLRARFFGGRDGGWLCVDHELEFEDGGGSSAAGPQQGEPSTSGARQSAPEPRCFNCGHRIYQGEDGIWHCEKLCWDPVAPGTNVPS